MSDIYTVLRQTIFERDLRSPSAREEIYGQARAAMIRQLWSYDPPMSEDEIDVRIGAFDLAVEELESEIAAAFARARPARRALPPAASPPPVYEGYDEEADYAPVFAGSGRTPARQPDERPYPVETDDPEELRHAAIEEALRGGSETPVRALAVPPRPRSPIIQRRPPEPEPPEPPRRDPPRRVAAAPVPARYEYVEEEEHLDNHPEEVAYEPDEDRRHDEPEPTHYEEPGLAGADDDHAGPAPRPRKPPPRKLRWQLSHRERVGLLVAAIAFLFVGLVAIVALAVIPRGGDPAAVAAATGTGGTATGSGDSQNYVIFDGRDPTVFEGGPGVPIRLDDDKEGAFARIASTASSAGVKVIVGPGLANRLAGRNIRVTVVARSARENGAVNLRFAYQSGVAISHWEAENLGATYASAALTWRVPSLRTSKAGDYILIEPGIPGDGTAAEIRSIAIDLLPAETG